jgi:hypothetical protein
MRVAPSATRTGPRRYDAAGFGDRGELRSRGLAARVRRLQCDHRGEDDAKER